MVNHPNRSRPLREINALLLAAAKKLADDWSAGRNLSEAMQALSAAIAKAEGRL